MKLAFGRFAFDSDTRELLEEGRRLHVSPKAFDLLTLLLERRPNVVSKTELHDRIWPGAFVGDANLSVVVAEIRQVLGDDSKDAQFIRTVHRVGYAFVAGGAAEEGARFSILLGGDEIPLRGGENVIGRDPHDAIVIRAPEVSRHHARLIVSGARVTLEDLGSKNGTFLGTRRVTSATEVRAGDEILVGTIRMRLVEVDALAPTATAG
jgi:DNA-binding winged helix-turn-helix (wHTH) protein